MPARKNKSLAPMVDPTLDEASWLLSHAEALADCGRQDEWLAELARRTRCLARARKELSRLPARGSRKPASVVPAS